MTVAKRELHPVSDNPIIMKTVVIIESGYFIWNLPILMTLQIVKVSNSYAIIVKVKTIFNRLSLEMIKL